ncbi:tryptophan synthase subunit alpha [Membranihabitans maritimus]|uniref:tryptophan synthase subunit alpha n=1 Tax=Membranihabitans maritimus TaxID=2904244 RepID=UPI001EFF8B6D|nr:tryptophan synthase subunit alpha [Membranihabitans maritimus]
MNRLKKVFENSKGKLLNIYFTAGYPRLDDTEVTLKALIEEGVDMIEIGMPYSDPMADGPTIQESSKIALDNGLTINTLFNQVESMAKNTNTPFILMGYLNQMMQFGVERFLDRCVECSIETLIIPDLPPDLYHEEYKSLFDEKGVSVVFLITPQTSKERIQYIDSISNSFIYVVSDSSITGKTKEISSEQQEYFQRIRDMKLNNPIMIGFGISDNKSFENAVAYADGAIIGSAFIKAIGNKKEDQSIVDVVRNFVNDIKG